MTDMTEFELDEATRGYIAEMNQQVRDLGISMNAALSLVCRINKLQGQWRLNENCTKMIRTDVPQPEQKANGAFHPPPQDPADYVS